MRLSQMLKNPVFDLPTFFLLFNFSFGDVHIGQSI